MKEYLVTVSLTKTMTADVTVEAGSKEEARAKIDKSPYSCGEPEVNEGSIETIDWEVEDVEESDQ